MSISKNKSDSVFRPVETCRGITLFAALCLAVSGARAGAYAGFDADQEGSRTTFLGIQGGDGLVYELFVGDIAYKYLDSGATVKVNQKIITPTIGIRRSGQWNFSASVGPTYNIKKEDNGVTKVEDTHTGGVVKLSLTSYQLGKSRELLGSYSTVDDFIWTRARLKKSIANNVAVGGEIFWMGNQDAKSYGAGILFDLSGESGGVTFKLGYKTSTNGEQTVYEGLDAYIPF